MYGGESQVLRSSRNPIQKFFILAGTETVIHFPLIFSLPQTNKNFRQTFATSATFILAMALNPEVQKKAQAEIDRVIGTDKVPTIADASKLPYTMAVLKETMRWHPPVPLSIPRRTTQDDTFNKYFIPKDTVVIPNLWAVSRSVANPEQFNPDRYLDKNMSSSIPDPSEWAFGMGRRICPGRYLAENSLKAIVTGILATFDILPPENEIILPEFTSTHVSYPKPFRCQIRPRSQEKEQLIKARVLEVKVT
ncbi:cytochrome P450 [Dendrothele bispora CBS 962.96]|uniref:Cytochrome P450 n=1 Tax=Dendrothele bispora (strain CBS 962.96) TaxID=1314807 RepID=A0A4S8MM08_DENBC|nr:cytochrome P450 [Dendrothele bispora CBS 962.96]